jgi:hypothetical protein
MTHQIKLDRAIKAANVFKGTHTLSDIMSGVPEILKERLTSYELTAVIEAVNAAYHKGKKSAGAEVIDDCVWVCDKLIPFTVLRALEITETIETVPNPSYAAAKAHFETNGYWVCGHIPSTTNTIITTRYKVDFVETN